MASFDFDDALREAQRTSQQPPSTAVIADLFKQLQRALNEGRSERENRQAEERKAHSAEISLNNIVSAQANKPEDAALKTKADVQRAELRKVFQDGIFASNGDAISEPACLAGYQIATDDRVNYHKQRAETYRHLVHRLIRERDDAISELNRQLKWAQYPPDASVHTTAEIKQKMDSLNAAVQTAQEQLKAINRSMIVPLTPIPPEFNDTDPEIAQALQHPANFDQENFLKLPDLVKSFRDTADSLHIQMKARLHAGSGNSTDTDSRIEELERQAKEADATRRQMEIAHSVEVAAGKSRQDKLISLKNENSRLRETIEQMNHDKEHGFEGFDEEKANEILEFINELLTSGNTFKDIVEGMKGPQTEDVAKLQAKLEETAKRCAEQQKKDLEKIKDLEKRLAECESGGPEDPQSVQGLSRSMAIRTLQKTIDILKQENKAQTTKIKELEANKGGPKSGVPNLGSPKAPVAQKHGQMTRPSPDLGPLLLNQCDAWIEICKVDRRSASELEQAIAIRDWISNSLNTGLEVLDMLVTAREGIAQLETPTSPALAEMLLKQARDLILTLQQGSDQSKADDVAKFCAWFSPQIGKQSALTVIIDAFLRIQHMEGSGIRDVVIANLDEKIEKLRKENQSKKVSEAQAFRDRLSARFSGGLELLDLIYQDGKQVKQLASEIEILQKDTSKSSKKCEEEKRDLTQLIEQYREALSIASADKTGGSVIERLQKLFEGTLKDLSDERTKLRNENNDAQEKLQKLKEQLDKVHAKIDSLGDLSSTLKRKEKECQSEKSELEKRIEVYQEAILKLEDRIENGSQNPSSDQQKELHEAKKELAHAHKAIADQNKKLLALDQREKKCLDEKEELNKKITLLQQRINIMESAAKDTHGAPGKTTSADTMSLIMAEKMCQKEKEALVAKVADLGRQISSAKGDSRDVNKDELKQLRDEIIRRIDSLLAKIQGLKHTQSPGHLPDSRDPTYEQQAASITRLRETVKDLEHSIKSGMGDIEKNTIAKLRMDITRLEAEVARLKKYRNDFKAESQLKDAASKRADELNKRLQRQVPTYEEQAQTIATLRQTIAANETPGDATALHRTIESLRGEITQLKRTSRGAAPSPSPPGNGSPSGGEPGSGDQGGGNQGGGESDNEDQGGGNLGGEDPDDGDQRGGDQGGGTPDSGDQGGNNGVAVTGGAGWPTFGRAQPSGIIGPESATRTYNPEGADDSYSESDSDDNDAGDAGNSRSLSKQLQALKDEVNNLKASNKTQKDQLDASSDGIKDACKARIAALNARIKELEAQVVSLQERLNNCQDETWKERKQRVEKAVSKADEKAKGGDKKRKHGAANAEGPKPLQESWNPDRYTNGKSKRQKKN